MKTHKPNKITLHCTDTPDGKPCPAETIDRWHRKRGFDKIGYHMVIQPTGFVENAGNSLCRGLNRVGAHVKGHNTGNLGISLVGRDKFTYAQFDALARQLDSIRQIYDIPEWQIWGHYEFDPKKTCPNMRIGTLLSWYLLGSRAAIKPYILD